MPKFQAPTCILWRDTAFKRDAQTDRQKDRQTYTFLHYVLLSDMAFKRDTQTDRQTDRQTYTFLHYVLLSDMVFKRDTQTDRHIRSFIMYCYQTWYSKETHRQTDIYVPSLCTAIRLLLQSHLLVCCYYYYHYDSFYGDLVIKKLHELNVNAMKNKAQSLWIHYLQDITYS